MLKDITIGQHFPGNSPVHRVDPRVKILLTFAYIVMLFLVRNLWGMLVVLAFLVLCYIPTKIPPRAVLRGLKPLIPILIFTGIINLFFFDGTPIFQFYFITITREGVFFALSLALRIVCLLAGTFLLTATTSPIALTDGIERLLSPLKYIKFPAHELAMMMTIALRYIPTLLEETDKIMQAQKARGADLETGGFISRIKALIPILIPLFLSAFRRAEELALAMECRCYRGGEGRTRMKQLRLKWLDLFGSLLFLAFFAGVFVCRYFFPAILDRKSVV